MSSAVTWRAYFAANFSKGHWATPSLRIIGDLQRREGRTMLLALLPTFKWGVMLPPQEMRAATLCLVAGFATDARRNEMIISTIYFPGQRGQKGCWSANSRDVMKRWSWPWRLHHQAYREDSNRGGGSRCFSLKQSSFLLLAPCVVTYCVALLFAPSALDQHVIYVCQHYDVAKYFPQLGSVSIARTPSDRCQYLGDGWNLWKRRLPSSFIWILIGVRVSLGTCLPGCLCIETFSVIKYDDIPKDRRREICHISMMCDVRSNKDNPNRTRIDIQLDQTPSARTQKINSRTNREGYDIPRPPLESSWQG